MPAAAAAGAAAAAAAAEAARLRARDARFRALVEQDKRRPARSCFLRLHSGLFCCINFGRLGRVVSSSLLRGRPTPGHPVYANTTQQTRRVFQALDIDPKSVERLYDVFARIDRDSSGEISLSEFFRFFSHKRRFPKKSKFARRCFQVMDEDGSGELDFQEFVVALWNFCTFNKPALLRFSFELYDADASGYIDPDELRLILREVYGKHKYKHTQAAVHILAQIQEMIDKGTCVGGLSLQDFNEFCRHHPALLYPAFELQQCLQQNIMGSAFWDVASKRRAKRTAKHGGGGHRRRGGSIGGGGMSAAPLGDMSYRELSKYLEQYGKATFEAREEDEWWGLDEEELAARASPGGGGISVNQAFQIADAYDDDGGEGKAEEAEGPRAPGPGGRVDSTKNNKYVHVQSPSSPKATLSGNGARVDDGAAQAVVRRGSPSRSSWTGRVSPKAAAVAKRTQRQQQQQQSVVKRRKSGGGGAQARSSVGASPPTPSSLIRVLSSGAGGVGNKGSARNSNSTASGKAWVCTGCGRLNTTGLCKVCRRKRGSAARGLQEG